MFWKCHRSNFGCFASVIGSNLGVLQVSLVQLGVFRRCQYCSNLECFAGVLRQKYPLILLNEHMDSGHHVLYAVISKYTIFVGDIKVSPLKCHKIVQIDFMFDVVIGRIFTYSN